MCDNNNSNSVIPLLISIFTHINRSKTSKYDEFRALYPNKFNFAYFHNITDIMRFIRDYLNINGYSNISGLSMVFTNNDGCLISILNNGIFTRMNIQDIGNNAFITIENGLGDKTLTTISVNNTIISDNQQIAIIDMIMNVLSEILDWAYRQNYTICSGADIRW